MPSWFSHHLEPTPIHLTYILISTFLLFYALLSSTIRNALHLSEPPIATLLGIAFGPQGASFLNPTVWGLEDKLTQEATRVIVGLQVFSVGVELPKKYLSARKNAVSVAILLGPVMAFSWIVTATLIHWVLHVKFTTGLIISACLAPTDPVLAASVLAESRFASRVPARIRHMLSCESGCNDGVSFPFLYIGLQLFLASSKAAAAREWFLGTILWQCALGTLLGLIIGKLFNLALRASSRNANISAPAFLVFYFLLAIFSVGVASTLGVDDFLVAFGAGYGFAYDGWFARKTQATHLPQILDLLLNSSMFIYFGTIIPWELIESSPPSPVLASSATINPARLTFLLFLILALRRIPIVLALKPVTPLLHTYTEALFVGHFGPMGVGALFLGIEARAMLETGTSQPLPHPDTDTVPPENLAAVSQVWAVVCFVVLGSVMVHGCSVVGIAVGGSLVGRIRQVRRGEGWWASVGKHGDWSSAGRRNGTAGERTRLLARGLAAGLGQEEDGLAGMVHDGASSLLRGGRDSGDEAAAEEEEDEAEAESEEPEDEPITGPAVRL